jgi:hypothetical protein
VLPVAIDGVVVLEPRRNPMKGRIALQCHPRLIQAVIFSFVLSLECLGGGCGAQSGSETASTTKELPPSAKGLQEHMKQLQKEKFKAKAGAPGRR